MKIALEAAHNVEVGDYAFGEKNYNGALLRYNDAVDDILRSVGSASRRRGFFPHPNHTEQLTTIWTVVATKFPILDHEKSDDQAQIIK